MWAQTRLENERWLRVSSGNQAVSQPLSTVWRLTNTWFSLVPLASNGAMAAYPLIPNYASCQTGHFGDLGQYLVQW